jgi:phosphoenolpyruvate carboxykinase (diphosphate)
MTMSFGAPLASSPRSHGGCGADLVRSLGLSADTNAASDHEALLRHVKIQLLANGHSVPLSQADEPYAEVVRMLVADFRNRGRLLQGHRCPADARIEAFLNDHFADVLAGGSLRLPERTLVLDRHGMARILSLPCDADEYTSEYVRSYRVKNGVLHNPRTDRRTTQGTFHVAAGGLPVPGDKCLVPRRAFVELFRVAMTPPQELLRFPFTAHQPQPACGWLTLLIRPLVSPAVADLWPEKQMETRLFAPGSLASNLDFVESIFGNAGDPFQSENDAGLDVVHWTGHTGAVILAPHLTRVTKRELGLPHSDEASERERRDGMCFSDERELYNGGESFKVTCRTEAGVIVTIIADNYFGYCKKEVKTQISYAANLYGRVEEEHAGGAIVFPSYNLGEECQVNSVRYNGRTFLDVVRDFPDRIDQRPEGYGIDKNFPNVVYIPESAHASLLEQRIRWDKDGQERSIPLLPEKVYIAPSGYQLRIERHPAAPSWRIIGTVGEGTFCHKPCTVSGGGKSEISKSIGDYMLYGPIFVADASKDFELVRFIFEKDYSTRWRHPRQGNGRGGNSAANGGPPRTRKLLDPSRSLGSVIKLLTPSPVYRDEYNAWLATIPNYIYALVFVIKRFYRQEWGRDWQRHFGVDIVNGTPGHELKYHQRQLVGTYLRVGLFGPSAWRTFKIRQDFAAAAKVQTEDDISASVVMPARLVGGTQPANWAASLKFVENCEFRLFQRPDDAVHRGLDKQTEADLARPDNFLSNFEPLSKEHVRDLSTRIVDFDAFSQPMQRLLRSAINDGDSYVVSSAHPRQIDGKPSKNPRYLQIRPDLADPQSAYVAEMGARLFRAVPADKPLLQPVNSVLLGRRNNPPDRENGILSLAVYNPIHYQELPELFMDFICSLTGKSPSTTGAGSEGALTKGPFNALRPAADLNAALVSFILTGLEGFSTAAGHIGPTLRVDHDLSLLVPEVWCRMSPEERDPKFLIYEGLLEPLADFEHAGCIVPASRLGYRITYEFVRRFFGRVFDNPGKIFDETILRPELQDRRAFAEGVCHIADVQRRVATQYYSDGTLVELCPPLQALVAIMAEGSWDGRTAVDEGFRSLFTIESLLASDWYRDRLEAQQKSDLALWRRHAVYLDQFQRVSKNNVDCERLQIASRKTYVEGQLARCQATDYLDELAGTIGVQPLTVLTGRTMAGRKNESRLPPAIHGRAIEAPV